MEILFLQSAIKLVSIHATYYYHFIRCSPIHVFCTVFAGESLNILIYKKIDKEHYTHCYLLLGVTSF